MQNFVNAERTCTLYTLGEDMVTKSQNRGNVLQKSERYCKIEKLVSFNSE